MRELKSVLPYFRPYLGGVFLGLVCVVFANVFQIAGPWFMKLAIDGMGDPDVTMGRITLFASMIVVTAIFGGAKKVKEQKAAARAAASERKRR